MNSPPLARLRRGGQRLSWPRTRAAAEYLGPVFLGQPQWDSSTGAPKLWWPAGDSGLDTFDTEPLPWC